MKRYLKNIHFLSLIIGILFLGCDNGEGPTSAEPSWQTIFEDNFDGDNLNTTNWTQFESSPVPYSLTGSGELKIDGTSGEEEGATFIYNTAIPGNTVKVITKFRTTQNDPLEDNVDMAIMLNGDLTANNFYALILTSDPIENTRDYTLSIYKYTNGVETELKPTYIKGIGGTKRQITANNNYILEGTNDNGTIIFTLKEVSENPQRSTTISIEDSTYSGGVVGFHGDLNIGTSGFQSIFFDNIKIQTYH